MKPPMPEHVRQLAEAARKRVKGRRTTGHLDAVREMEGADSFASPWAEQDDELWLCLLLDAFGTRLPGVVAMFIRQLRSLCPDGWIVPEDGTAGYMQPDREAMEQALSILCALQPRDEAQAAMAAQAVALHLAAMKVSAHMGGQGFLHPQSASALAGLTKAYQAAVRSLQQLQNGGKAKRQTIEVRKNVQINYNDNRSLTLPDASGAGNLRALPSPDEEREAVPIPSR